MSHVSKGLRLSFLTRPFDINIQTVSVQVGLWGSEHNVSSLAVLQGPLPLVNSTIHIDGQQRLIFGL